MIKINVWIQFADGTSAHAGEMVCTDPDGRGRREGAFRYTPSYLDNSRAFSLDPVALPLAGDEFVTSDPSGVFPVFKDSLPDDWGRDLLAKKANLPRNRQTSPNLLLALGAHGMGALSFSEQETPKGRPNYAPESLLETLLVAGEHYERGKFGADHDLSSLLQVASSPGGSRPKALIDSDDALWIAKFPSVKDSFAVENIEAATLSLAKKAAIDVPEFRLINVAGRDVLMVRRFDVTVAGGRNHMISMQTLLNAEAWHNLGYGHLFDILRRFSSQPEIDLPLFFRQMVFNALIGDTDDHLKNFMMIRDETGYRLSPAYDLLPDIEKRREHVLMFEHDHFVADLSVLERIGRSQGIRKPREIIEQVKTALVNWRDEFDQYAVPAEDIRRLESGIKKTLEIG